MNIRTMYGGESIDVEDAGLCLLSYRGSIAHNMYVPNTDPNSIDDVDLIGVVVAEPKHYFGLHEWGSRGTKEIKQDQFDVVLYEIRKAFSLLLRGNPNILSLLWARPDAHLFKNQAGAEIIAHRDLFAGKHVYDAFAGYAHTQLSKMETRDPAELRMYLAVTAELKHRGIHPNHKGDEIPLPTGHDSQSGEAGNCAAMRDEVLLAKHYLYVRKGENLGYLGDKRKQLILNVGYDAKNAAHCIRLLRMGVEFLSTGTMAVYRDRDSDELLAIKRGESSLARIKAEAESLFEQAKEARDRSPLPDEPDSDAAEELLIQLVRESLV